MPNLNDSSLTVKSKSLLLCGLMIVSVLSLTASTVTASPTPQNDFGTSGSDLPDSMSNPSAIPNIIFSGQISGNGQLIPASDYDYLKVNLASNEGLAAELSFDVRDDFDIAFLDSSGHSIDSSWQSNPEYVTTNGSGYSGFVYIQIVVNTHQPPIYDENYTITIWKFTAQSTQTQNDLAWNTDLPNNQAAIPGSPYIVQLNGQAPTQSGILTGELDWGDNADWHAISLNTNEGLAVQIDYSSTYTSPSNGTVYTNEFDLYIYDSNMNLIDESFASNPEYVSTNNSFTGSSHGGTIYINIFRYSGIGSYNFQAWTFSTSVTNPSNQNDIGLTNYDLPNTLTALAADPNWPLPLNGGAPLYSGITNAELDLNGDNEDFLSFTLDANEGFAFQISYSSFVFVNGSLVTNDFIVRIYDVNMNLMDGSAGNNPQYVTTNNSATAHGGIIYVEINRYSGYGVYDIEFWTWSTSSGGGAGGQPVPNPCNDVGVIGSGSTVPDILEPNDSVTVASSASILPIYCNGLSFDTSSDEDFFEIQTIIGVTYYVNISFSHSNGDIDMEWEDSSGLSITGSYGTSNFEQMQWTATTNTFTYVRIYTLGFSGSNYNLEITTDNPGGGQSFTNIDVEMNNLTNFTIEVNGLTVGDTYEYTYSSQVFIEYNLTFDNRTTLGPYSFTATNTTQYFNHTVPAGDLEAYYNITATLFDASGAVIQSDTDSIYQEVIINEATSSTTGDIFATNLSVGQQYSIYWMTFNIDVYIDQLMLNPNVSIEDALNVSRIDEGFHNFTASSPNYTHQVIWVSPTTMDFHLFYSNIFTQGSNASYLANLTGYHFFEFEPQLPSAIITSYSASTTSTTNDFTSEGLDLVVGDIYYQQFRVEDPNSADIAYSALVSVNATAQNMSFGTFYYNTPTDSGLYCLFSDLYDANYVQIVGDSVCIQFVFDDDNDGVANEQDLCPSTPQGAIVDLNGCALSQKDTDGDGYNDDVDDFPYENTQWLDTDGDGYGDNLNGNSPDLFPTDYTQWQDFDGDGYGDNLWGNYPDEFPFDPTQWADSDGDGYGDNANGNNPDLWPNDSSQWTDSDGDGFGDNPLGTAGDAFPFEPTQWADSDGDGYGDNWNGNDPDLFPNDSTQWYDRDGDGYGDNANGNNADKFPDDSTQWHDSDSDGFGDNQQGNNPDLFPSDGTQWADQDGDGYGDNQNGNNPDRFPQDSTQWQDSDYDGLGDNANGNNPDLCPGTPFGDTVDNNGCSTSQTDADSDGVADSQDGCPNTTAGEFVDANGCSETQLDDDNDGVVNQYDLCPFTPLNSFVDSAGCADSQLDTDYDGINDAIDACPATTPNALVDGFGCAANQRDIDGDGVNDNLDTCPNTPESEIAANNGCSESQTDSDLDGVFNNVDQCPNTTLTDLDGDGSFDVDSVGCSPIQYDDDDDQIDNTIDSCPATPSGEQVDSVGCSQSQLDEDNDDIWNSDDLCFDTQEGRAVDQNGCSEFQKDDDQDNLVNANDACPNTPIGEIIDANGCSLTQLDSDGDGVNDLLDAFPNDSNESVDTDGDGVPDRLDAYPQDVTRSEAKAEEDSNGFMFILAAIFAIGVIGALLIVRGKGSTDNQLGFSETTYEDYATETNIQATESAKEIPSLESEPVVEQNQTWEENGVHWSMAPDGTLSYYDNATQSWLLFQN